MKIVETKLKWRGPFGRRMGGPPGVVWHNAAASRCTIEDIHRWHLANGWLGCAYHYFVRKDGTIYRGRPEWAVGGHTFKHGTWLGVCCEGNFDKEKMTAKQLDACLELQRHLTARYGDSLRIRGHREMPGNSTSCPGRNFPLRVVKEAGEPPKVDIRKLKSAMLSWAKDHKMIVPAGFAVNDNWGPAAKTLAWRISGKLKAAGKDLPQSAQPTAELYRAIFS